MRKNPATLCVSKFHWNLTLKARRRVYEHGCNIFYALNMNKGSKHVFIVDTLLSRTESKMTQERKDARTLQAFFAHALESRGPSSNGDKLIDCCGWCHPCSFYTILYSLYSPGGKINPPPSHALATVSVLCSLAHTPCAERHLSSFAALHMRVPQITRARCPTDASKSRARSTDLLSNMQGDQFAT